MRPLIVLLLCALVAAPLLGEQRGPQATAKFRPKAKHAIPNQWIVTLSRAAAGQPGPSSRAAAVAAELSRNYFISRILDVSTKYVNDFLAEMPPGIAQLVSRDPRVESVEQNSWGSVLAVQPDAPWALDRVDQRQGLDTTYGYNATGAGVDVYVLDTTMRLTHEQFQGRAIFTGIDKAPPEDFVPPCDPEDPECPPPPSVLAVPLIRNHGTQVGALVGGWKYGTAKQVRILSVRVANDKGNVDCALSKSAIYDVMSLHQQYGRRAVMNLSWQALDCGPVDTAVRAAIAAGMTVVVAAGNRVLQTQNWSPQRVAEAVVVGGTSINDNRFVQSAFQSNYGPELDLFAPGQDVDTAYGLSDTDFGPITGTSFSAGLVSGVAAMYLQVNPSHSPALVQQALVSNATDNAVGDPGPGSPNKLLYSAFVGVVPPTPTPTPTVGPSPMQSSSAIRGCSNYFEWSPSYQPTANACYSHCVANGANSCEWNQNGSCYVEFGNNCSVQGGYPDWSAAVINAGNANNGEMQSNSAVRECQGYQEMSPVYKPDQNSCRTHCIQNGADACEWHVASGDCYAEFGNSCQVQAGFTGWYAAVFSEPTPETPTRLAMASSRIAPMGLGLGVLSACGCVLFVQRRRMLRVWRLALARWAAVATLVGAIIFIWT